jgi:PAS domain S-box-containing protein
MATAAGVRLLSALRAFSQAAAVTAIAAGGSVLLGWACDLELLKSVLPGRVAMNPVTALVFILAGFSLWLLRTEWVNPGTRRVGQACAILVAFVGLLKLSEYLLGWHWGLDQILWPQRLGTNRMAPNTALNFVLVGLSLLLLGLEAPRGPRAAQIPALGAALVSLLGLIGYTYGVTALYGVASHVPMALNTTVAFLVLCAGVLCARPDRGLMALVTSETVGGVMARRLLPAAVAIPTVLGWLRLAGEQAGLYDTAFGVALSTVLSIVILAVVVLLTTHALNRAEAERRRAAEALQQAAEEIRDLYNNAPCGYHSLDADGTIIAANDTELRWLGYAREELVGKAKFADLLTPKSRTTFKESFPRFKEQGRVNNLELELLRKNGTVMPVLLNATAIRDDAGRYVASRSTLVDITERQQAEKTIRLYTDVVNNVPIGLTLWRLDDAVEVRSLRLVAANPAASRLTGVEMSGLLGMTMSQAFPAVREAELTLYAEVVRSGKPVDVGEIYYHDERLAPNYWSVKAFPLPDCCVGIAFENVTRRKQVEEDIRRLNDDLERRVLERTAELAQANRELAQKNRENELFVYSVSHDLRSPLVNLQGFSEELGMVCQDLRTLLAEDHLPPAVRERGLALLDGDMAESLRFIRAGVMRLSGIIDALLRLSRAGRVEYQWQQVEVRAVVARVVESLSGTIAERQATVAMADLPPVWGDPTAVEQIFANLIGNALNYLDPGRPGVIEVGRASPAAAGEAHGHAAQHIFYVKDNGLGIPEAYRPKVFQAFQRLHPHAANGEGIGLVLVRRLVERHAGRVWLESSEGVGSTFFLMLPVPAGNGTSQSLQRNGAFTEVGEQAPWQRNSSSFC